MSSIGTGYDLAASTFSPDGRIFQVEYANKAVESSASIIALGCKDGVLVAVDQPVPSKLTFGVCLLLKIRKFRIYLFFAIFHNLCPKINSHDRNSDYDFSIFGWSRLKSFDRLAGENLIHFPIFSFFSFLTRLLGKHFWFRLFES